MGQPVTLPGPITIPPKSATSGRSDAEHEAIYRMFILEGLSGTITAQKMAKLFPDGHWTRLSINSYSHRNGWTKGAPDGHGRIPPPDATTKRPTSAPGPLSGILADMDPIIGTRVDEHGVELPLRRKSCRWPVGKTPRPGSMADLLFCGDAAGDGEYCHPHHKLAYPSTKGT